MALISRVRVLWTGVGGSPAYTNLYVARGTVTASQAVTAVAAYMNSISALVTSSCTLTTEGDVAVIDTATGNIVGVDTGTSVVKPGTGGAGQVPSANQVLVRWLTNTYLGGRQVRGRMYLPYFASGAVGTNGQVTGATQTAVNNATSAYITGLTGQACVFSPANGVAVQISGYNVWNQFAVMRSRRD